MEKVNSSCAGRYESDSFYIEFLHEHGNSFEPDLYPLREGDRR